MWTGNTGNEYEGKLARMKLRTANLGNFAGILKMHWNLRTFITCFDGISKVMKEGIMYFGLFEMKWGRIKGLWKTNNVTVTSFLWQKWFSETSSSTRAVTSLTLTSLSTSRCGERPCSTLWVWIGDNCNSVKVTLGKGSKKNRFF